MRPLRHALLAALALAAPGCRRPHPAAPDGVAAPVAPTPSSSPSSPSVPSAAPAVAPPAYSAFDDDAALLDEATDRVSRRLAPLGRAFRMLAVDLGYSNPTTHGIFLGGPEDVALGEGFESSCEAHPLALGEATHRAILTTFVTAAHRASPRDPEGPTLGERVATTLSTSSSTAAVGCVTRASNALVELPVGAFTKVFVRRVRGVLVDIVDSSFHLAMSDDATRSATGRDAYLDFTGDGVNDVLVGFTTGSDNESDDGVGAPRTLFLELYSADLPRAQRVPPIRAEACARDSEGAQLRRRCSDRGLPMITVFYDRDRWLLRAGLRTYRVNAQGNLVAAPPVDPALAAWLGEVHRHEALLDALDAELARETPIALRRGSITAALVALGEGAEDAARAEQRLVNLDAARASGRAAPGSS